MVDIDFLRPSNILNQVSFDVFNYCKFCLLMFLLLCILLNGGLRFGLTFQFPRQDNIIFKKTDILEQLVLFFSVFISVLKSDPFRNILALYYSVIRYTLVVISNIIFITSIIIITNSIKTSTNCIL